jgi:hypothetical protein
VLTELGFVAAGLVCYLIVSWYTAGQTASAVANAHDVLALQQRLGLDWEQAIQDATLVVPWLSGFLAHFYVWGYLPVMAAALVWLYVRRPETYPTLRNAMLVSGAVGMATYALYPCAPPRISHAEFADTVASGSLELFARPVWMNELGAIPSFHCGWLMLAAFVVFRATTSTVLRVWCVVHPAVMCYAVLASGNHWVIDIPIGAAVAALGMVVATRVIPALPTAPPAGRARRTAPPHRHGRAASRPPR